MGEYFHIANNTKKQYLHDHDFHDFGFVGGHGIKWGEIVFNKFGSLQLLAILISTDCGFGRRQNPSFIGDWIGDSIGIYGDYSSYGEFHKIVEEYEDITPKLIKELLEMPYWKELIEPPKT